MERIRKLILHLIGLSEVVSLLEDIDCDLSCCQLPFPMDDLDVRVKNILRKLNSK